jgi:hypothetical protein
MLYIPEILLGLQAVRILVARLDGHQEITISGRDIIFRRDCRQAGMLIKAYKGL